MKSLYQAANGLNELRDNAYITALEKGWWEQDKTFGDVLALIHSEVSEVLEAHRKNFVYIMDKHPIVSDEVQEELADIIIRVLDVCGKANVNIGRAVYDKMVKNEKRLYRHGGKAL